MRKLSSPTHSLDRPNASSIWKDWSTAWPAGQKKKMPMMSTSEVSLKKPMKVFTSGGITVRSACGRMMKPVFCQ